MVKKTGRHSMDLQRENRANAEMDIDRLIEDYDWKKGVREYMIQSRMLQYQNFTEDTDQKVRIEDLEKGLGNETKAREKHEKKDAHRAHKWTVETKEYMQKHILGITTGVTGTAMTIMAILIKLGVI